MKDVTFILLLVTVVVGTAITDPTAGPLTSSKQNQTTSSTNNTTTVFPNALSSPNGTIASSTNGTVSQGNGFMKYLDNGVMYRMLYVIIGLSSIVAIYFIVRALKTRRRKSKSKKYGVIDGGVDMELQPLDNDEDEEDMTLFDVSKNRWGRHK